MSNQVNPDVVYFPKQAVARAAQQFETPFFIYSEKRLRENCRKFRDSFRKFFPDFEPLYAVKANNNPAVLEIIKEEGFGFDCSSEYEAWIAQKIAKKNGHDVFGMYTGNYTPVSTLKFAQECGLILNLDDISMVSFLKEIGVPESLSFRINPGIGKGAYESLVTAGPDAKFGVPFEKAGEAYSLAKEAGVKKFGIHMMTGSNLLEEDYFAQTVAKLLEIVADVKAQTDITIDYMNIGGGFGVPYHPEENSLNLEKLAAGVKEAFDKECQKYDLKPPILMAEPGRYIMADSGWLIGKVQVIKDGYKKFVGIDASSNDMPRPSIYGAYHYVSVMKKAAVSRLEELPDEKVVQDNDDSEARIYKEVVTIVGTICENNDQLAKDRELPVCEIGDIIVIHNCGGHAYAMGHNYNGKLRHAEYLLRENGKLRMIRRAETFEDLYFLTS